MWLQRRANVKQPHASFPNPRRQASPCAMESSICPIGADEHQAKRARNLAQAGGAVPIPESDCNAERLSKELTSLLSDPDRLRNRSSRARTLAHPDPLRGIAEMAVRLASHTSR